MKAQWILIGLVASALTGCDPADAPRGGGATTQPATTQPGGFEQVRQQTAEAIDAARRWADAKREQYFSDAQRELERLAERTREATRNVRPEVERRLEDLRRRAAEAREALERAGDASEKAWEDAKQRFENAMRELREGVTTAPATQPVEAPAPPEAP